MPHTCSMTLIIKKRSHYVHVMFQLPVSPGEYSHSDGSNHAMSLGMGHYRSGAGHDNLPISDNNVSTTNDALEAGEWEVPEHEADLDVSILRNILSYTHMSVTIYKMC